MRMSRVIIVPSAMAILLIAGPASGGVETGVERKLTDKQLKKIRKGFRPPAVKIQDPKLPAAGQAKARCYMKATKFLKLLKEKVKLWVDHFAGSVLDGNEKYRFLNNYRELLDAVKSKDCSGGIKASDPSGG